MTMTSAQIRQQFIEFFVQKHGHTFVPSSPVVPVDDPTLLFTNAGMNQFKPIFLGESRRPYTRAVNTQKCIRAGGKHNDLDDVGKDTYHHTFFEMLGNWSFGDYFKAEAIRWAWELLTQVWGLDKSRLHVTVFMGDPTEGLEADLDAAKLWKTATDIDPSHVHLGNKKDNFWEMGATGPCGPCSEIHIDFTPDKSGARLVNAGDARVMEIWNLVFIQFNRGTDGRLTPLPARHVDTGMGFERICRVLQGKQSNYDTDVFTPIMAAIGERAKAQYTGKLDDPKDIAFRVIADHLRMSTFAITDGAIPGNKGRNSVVRSVIRRAVRYGYQVLNFREPFLHSLVPVLVGQMGEFFPELTRSPIQVADVIKSEEADFLRTVERGLGLFEEAAGRCGPKGAISGRDVFELHTTYGFFPDMTKAIAADRGLAIDEEGYQQLFRDFQHKSGEGRKQHGQVAVDLSGVAATDDSPKYSSDAVEVRILAWAGEHVVTRHGRLDEDQQAALLLDRTPFYAEQGGQVGDTGVIQTATGRFVVSETQRKGDWVLHWGTVADGHIEVGQQAAATVDSRRSDTMRNHTATHLLNWALRKVLGEQVQQKGSLVDPDKLRFDFNQDKALSADETNRVERLVNEKIYADLLVTATVMPLAQAKRISGVRAVFGEKYPDPVRVIAIEAQEAAQAGAVENSVEFCGGTHLSRTGQAGFFKIISEELVSKGVRRITAVTGRGAVEHIQGLSATAHQIAQTLSAPLEDVPRRITALQDEVKTLKKKLSAGGGGAQDPKAFADELLAANEPVMVAEYKSATQEQMLAAIDSIKKRKPTYAVMLGAVIDDKASFVAAVSDDLIAKGVKAGDWIRETAKVAGGGGGGRPQLAQAGGKDPGKLGEALEKAKAEIVSQMRV